MNREESVSRQRWSWWDRLGVWVSGLCLVHCLLVPLSLALFPVAGSHWIHDESLFHKVLFIVIIAIVVVAFYVGFRAHKNTHPVKWMVAGLLFVSLGTFWTEQDLMLATVIMFMGSICLIRAHFLNHSYKHLRDHKDCGSCQKLTIRRNPQ